MAELGHYSLILAFIVSVYGVITAFMGGKRGSPELSESAFRSVWALFGLLSVASIALVYLLAVRDLNVEYVARYTSTKLPIFYAIPAFWAGNGGSLLLWVWILSVFATILVWRHRDTETAIVPYTTGILLMIAVFLLGIILFLFKIDTEMSPTQSTDPFYGAIQAIFGITSGLVHPSTNPFWRLPFTPAEGLGLNPQLQNPGMLIHPPTLYLGYVGMSIPFAFAMASLIVRRMDNQWIYLTRRWNLVAWLFLSIGNILGAWWAYVTLGWGGYWAWDPVENAAFIPWLLSTAFLHSIIVQERRDVFKIWNMVLIIAAFASTIFGTYLTRSGVISSVHAFAKSQAFNIVFLSFLAVVIAASMYLLFTRLDILKPDRKLESFLSRESAFLFNNVLLVGAAFIVLFGTMFPLISQAIMGVQKTMGPEWFDAVLWPLWGALLFLMGAAPMLGWSKSNEKALKFTFLSPVAAGVFVMITAAIFGVRNGFALGFFGLAAFALAAVIQEIVRGTLARSRVAKEPKPQAFKNLFVRQNRRFGGYIVHIGIAILVIGITASSIYQEETDMTLSEGQHQSAGDYGITFEQFHRFSEPNRDVYAADVTITKNGEPWRRVTTVQEDYKAERMRWTKPKIISTFTTDVYVTLSSFTADGSVATINLKVNPLVPWMWIGSIISVIGTLIAMWPSTREKRQRELLSYGAETTSAPASTS